MITILDWVRPRGSKFRSSWSRFRVKLGSDWLGEDWESEVFLKLAGHFNFFFYSIVNARSKRLCISTPKCLISNSYGQNLEVLFFHLAKQNKFYSCQFILYWSSNRCLIIDFFQIIQHTDNSPWSQACAI